MFELLVEILHKDDSWTREPYAQCQIVQHTKTGEKRRLCKAFKYATREGCLAKMEELDAEWRAGPQRDGPRGWVRWEMRCVQVDAPLVS